MTDIEKTKQAAYLVAFLPFLFGLAFWCCGGARRMRRTASSNGIGVRSGFDCFSSIVGV